jgi:hypothetical protein
MESAMVDAVQWPYQPRGGCCGCGDAVQFATAAPAFVGFRTFRTRVDRPRGRRVVPRQINVLTAFERGGTALADTRLR